MRSVSPFVIFLLLAVALATLPATPSQADFIALFDDSLRTDCSESAPPGQRQALFHVFHYSSSGATGSRFQLPKPACEFFDISGPMGPQLTAFPFTGSFKGGVEFQYGACLTGWIYLGVVFYLDIVGLGSYPICCEYPPVAHPSATTGQVEAFDCRVYPTL